MDNEAIVWILDQFKSMGASDSDIEKEKKDMISNPDDVIKNLILLDFP